MAAVDLPTHVTLAAATAATVTLKGPHSKVDVLNQSTTSMVYCRADGGTPVVAADLNYPISGVNGEPRCIATVVDSGGASTTLRFISAGTPTVSIMPCTCDD